MIKTLLDITIWLKDSKNKHIATMDTTEEYIPYLAVTFPKVLDFIN